MVDLAHKGKQFQPFTFTIERGKLHEFLLAIGEANPAYRTEDPPLPPTFPTLFLFWGGGGLEGALQQIGVDIWKVLHAEQEYEHHMPLHIGDTVTAKTRVNDIYEKAGMSGPLRFVEFVTEYRNQDGVLAVSDRAVIIVRG